MFIVRRIDKRYDHEMVEYYYSMPCYRNVTSSKSGFIVFFISSICVISVLIFIKDV